ncbi:MAG: nucleoside-diphosphate kinase [Myxococcota bacterium]|jgi:nucleoside-diphosphate kinase|nr:nucleoside-diphosphate kinase [Myxococcota bacterium]
MAIERTLSIIKPDATENNNVGGILQLIEKSGLRIVAMRRMHLTKAQAGGFYEVHKERPFFGELVDFMTRSPVVVSVLEGEDAVAKYREVMGATDPKKAADGTIRKLFAKDIGENSVHGSDSLENAKREIAFFFAEADLL